MSNDRSLDRKDLNSDPIKQFDAWYKEFLQSHQPEPSAMALATASRDCVPSVRFVLLKEYDSKGFVFFTNYESEKGHTLSDNPLASLAFYWNVHNRQVRVVGRVEKVSAKESDSYFASRPVESQLSTWASRQSRVIESREELEAQMRDLRAKYKDVAVPRPPYWGGFRIIPDRIEFWQGRTGRLHDRFLYRREGQNWTIERLSP